MSGRILKNRYGYGMIPESRRSASPREASSASWRRSRRIGANGSGGGAGTAVAGLGTSTIVGIATLVTVVALAIAFIATSATMFPALLKDIDKLEDKSELCFCDKFDSDVFGLLKPDNPMIEVQFYLGNLSLNGTYLYTAPDKNGTLALLSDIPLVPTSFSDADFFLYNDIDPSKQAHFDVGLLSGATNQTYSFPNLNGTFVLTTGIQSLDDKILTSATITSNTNVVHASHLRTLTTPVDVSLATAPTPGQVLTYVGGIGDWQTPLDPVTTGNFTTTNITGFGGPWTIVPTSVLVEWSIISTTTLVANMRWVGGEFGGVGNYGITFPVPWQMSPETFGTINILDINAPNELDIPWYINPSSPGLMSTTGTVTALAAKNATGFGNFQGIIVAFIP